MNIRWPNGDSDQVTPLLSFKYKGIDWSVIEDCRVEWHRRLVLPNGEVLTFYISDIDGRFTDDQIERKFKFIIDQHWLRIKLKYETK